jgi:hypothetical protein
MWTGYLAPYTILWSIAIRQGDIASCQVLPCPVVLQWAVVPFRRMQSPQAWIFDEGLTVWVPVLPNLYTEYIVFIRACLSYARAIMTFMRVSLIELLHQAAMGRVLALEYMLSGAHGLL